MGDLTKKAKRLKISEGLKNAKMAKMVKLAKLDRMG